MSSKVEKARNELSKRLEELESRIKRLEELIDLMNLIEISWRIAQIEAFSQRLLTSSRNELITIPRFEEELREYLNNLNALIKLLRSRMKSVNWKLVEESTSTVIHAAKEAGLPFRAIANLMIEKLGDDVVKVVSEKDIEEAYGLIDLNYWRRLLRERRFI
ncbi:MAG: hypothetical protein J7L79_00945 [Thaumarchaeota archaeon]|nr:hypothetical protein [Nitrososphaerota archaeon]